MARPAKPHRPQYQCAQCGKSNRAYGRGQFCPRCLSRAIADGLAALRPLPRLRTGLWPSVPYAPSAS
jgi:hypothetical protein